MTEATVQHARQFLKGSIAGRAETGTVISAVLDLNIIPKDSPLYKDASQLSDRHIRYGSNGLNNAVREVDRLSSKDWETYTSLLSLEAPESVSTATTDREYAKAVTDAIRGGLDALGVSPELSAEEALRSLNNTNFRLPDGCSKNRWKKALRFLNRIEETIARAEENINDREAFIAGKSRLSESVNVESLDDRTLAAVAYLVSRASRRSIFGLKDQSKAFDSIHVGLVGLLDDSSDWFELAKVYPTGVAFKHLDDSQLGELLGVFYDRMVTYGTRLGELYEDLPLITQNQLITRQGTDSSRWNAYSGGYNTMRSAWVNLMTFLELSSTFETFLPGKAPRIMAADLVWFREAIGRQELHPDTDLFFRFPKPWEIISGEKTLNVEEARKFDGWTAPLKNVETEKPSLEPALVHGVIVASPAMAELLRKSGAYAGAKVDR